MENAYPGLSWQSAIEPFLLAYGLMNDGFRCAHTAQTKFVSDLDRGSDDSRTVGCPSSTCNNDDDHPFAVIEVVLIDRSEALDGPITWQRAVSCLVQYDKKGRIPTCTCTKRHVLVK